MSHLFKAKLDGCGCSQAIRYISSMLSAGSIENAWSEATRFVIRATQLDRTFLIANPDRAVSSDEAATLSGFVARRLAGEPITRILGFREFWNLEIEVAPDVLDPRPDSETLIEAALAELGSRKAEEIDLLDLGTGSGALLLAMLAECPRARGIGVDLSPKACELAARNARRNKLSDRAHILRGNWMESLDGRFDLIISNPPYIRAGEIGGLPPEVLNHDPILALNGGGDGLVAYSEIIRSLDKVLKPKGFAVLELGAGQAADVADLALRWGLKVGALRKDLGGIDRAIVLHNPG
jgi:release factor glutamine methyltransferase